MDNMNTLDLLTFFFIAFVLYAILLPQLQLWNLRRSRMGLIREMERAWGSRVLTMVHKKEAISLFGLPIYQFDVIVHSPGGQLLPSIQIARALKNHPEKTRAIIPHYAMSGGTIIALACDEIVMDPDAVIGPIDPQVGDFIRGSYPAHSWIYATEMKGKNADDTSFVMRHISEKALRMMSDHLRELLEDRVDEASFEKIEKMLLGGENVHSLPISSSEARGMGLAVTTEVPPQVHRYMSTFRAVKSSVEYLR
jgi:ClpP class serine protease